MPAIRGDIRETLGGAMRAVSADPNFDMGLLCQHHRAASGRADPNPSRVADYQPRKPVIAFVRIIFRVDPHAVAFQEQVAPYLQAAGTVRSARAALCSTCSSAGPQDRSAAARLASGARRNPGRAPARGAGCSPLSRYFPPPKSGAPPRPSKQPKHWPVPASVSVSSSRVGADTKRTESAAFVSSPFGAGMLSVGRGRSRRR